MKILRLGLASTAVCFVAATAYSAPVYEPTFYGSTGTCLVGDLTVAADDCFGTVLPEPVNDDNNLSDNDNDNKANFNLDYFGGTLGLFGKTDWSFLTKVNTGTGGGVTEGTDIGLTLDPDTGGAPGTWSVNAGSLSMYEYITVILKQSNTFAAYLYDGVIPEGGSWTSEAFDLSSICATVIRGQREEEVCGIDNSGGLSHFSIYVGPEKPNVIPLPAAGWLLLAGLGGLAAYGRKKRWA